MNKEIYYVKDGQRIGPIRLSDFIALNLPGTTLIWYQGLTDWVPANQAPVTAGLYGGAAPSPAPNIPNPGYNSQPYNPNRHTMPKPDSYLVWGILTTLFCCLPFGIVSIVYASKVDSLYAVGRYDEAVDASLKAKNWALASAVSALVLGVVYAVSIAGVGLL